MKKLLLAMIGLVIGAICYAQAVVPVTINGGKNATEIVENTSSTLKFTNKLSEISLANTIENGETYSKIAIDGYISNNKIGYPQLPVMVKMIEVPMGAEIVTNVTVNSERVVSLADAGFSQAIVPCQPALFKNKKKEDLPFAKNVIYSNGGLYSPEIVTIEEAGIMRGIRLVKVIVNPFAYDIDDNALTIRDDISVELSFSNTSTRSNAVKDSKYSPAFGAMYDKIWNYKQTRNAEMHYPIKYVIVSDRMFEEALQPFIAWKTKKGFNVVTAYTDEIGRTESAVHTYLQGLYDAATAEDPAPSYVLYVGDTTQISVQWSKLEHTTGWMGDENDHYTDVYKVCFDGANDYIPDMFFGRFSAQNVSQLTPQIEKTLMFEQYTFPDPSYLGDAVLVAGYDETDPDGYDDINGNGQINYATQYYFNDEHSVNTTVYLSPESHTSGDAIKTQISEGVGFVNYSAHCNYDGWQDPEFNVSDVNNLQNESEYFFSIGNCCLSNKFDVDECFGEALLRKSGKGAVCHIGGTNSTIWNEDFYWSVGTMQTINVNPTYEETGLGAYDHLFHERGEAPYVSAGEIVFIGNFSVNSSTSEYIQYYWEIYTLMGDPSLMPYVGVPTQMNPEYYSIVPVGTSTLNVTAETLSYIALSKDGVLLDAQYTGNGTSAVLSFEELSEPGELDLVITRQFRVPYIQKILVVSGTEENNAALMSIDAPESAMSAQNATFQPQITIMNIGTANLTSLSANYTINDGTPVNTSWTGNLAQYETATITFDEITLETGVYQFDFVVEDPNGQTDEDPSNNIKSRSVLVSAGNVTIVSVTEPNGEYCNYTEVQPTIIVKNNSAFAVTSLVASYTCDSISNEQTFDVNIPAEETASIAFNPVAIPEGLGRITFVVRQVNGGENQTQAPKSANYRIVHDGERFRLSLTADYNDLMNPDPNETTWDIKDDENNVLYSGAAGNYTGNPVVSEFCLGEGCYTFNLYDSQGNGLAGFYGYATGSAVFSNINTNETLLSVGSESFSTRTVNFCVGTVSAPEEFATEMSIYPNPTTGMLNVTSNEEIDSIEIFNSIGTTVATSKATGNNTSIDMSNLPNGMYFVRIFTANGIETVKVVLER